MMSRLERVDFHDLGGGQVDESLGVPCSSPTIYCDVTDMYMSCPAVFLRRVNQPARPECPDEVHVNLVWDL